VAIGNFEAPPSGERVLTLFAASQWALADVGHDRRRIGSASTRRACL